MYDVIIIGGGPAGYTAAERAGVEGLNVLLIERQNLGGVCLNEGCIPTKTLLYSAKVLDTVKNASKYAVTTGEAFPDFERMMARKNKIIRKLVAGIKIKMKEADVVVLEGKGFVLNKKDDEFEVVCNDQTFQGKNLLLCTGSIAGIPAIEGLQDIDFWTSKEALSAKTLPKSITIIGGGVIGMEFASFYNCMGVKVSVVEMTNEILGEFDHELAGMLRNEYTKRGIDFYLETKIIGISENELIAVDKNGKQIPEKMEQILLCTGRKPRTEGFGLECLELKKNEKGGIWTDATMQTSQQGVYACGDITGHSLLAHTASREAEVAINHIIGKKDKMSYKAIPGVVYTNPELAGVGFTEDELIKKNIPYQVLKLPMTYSGRFVAENEGSNGLCKILIDENNVIKGVHLLGNPASEFITVATMAIEENMTVDKWRKIVFPHPTIHEIIKETLFSRNTD